jgi:hypothetical protein
MLAPKESVAHCVCCIAFDIYIDALYASDEEYYDWICPWVGLVKRSFGEDDSKGFLLQSIFLPE